VSLCGCAVRTSSRNFSSGRFDKSANQDSAHFRNVSKSDRCFGWLAQLRDVPVAQKLGSASEITRRWSALAWALSGPRGLYRL
jgi:hypothetical protein